MTDTIRTITAADAEWPAGLNDLGIDAPETLYVRGTIEPGMFDKSIAIVGARAATSYGERIAMDLAEGLSRAGYLVVSGAAYGIDGAAHRAALATGHKTAAFLAGGVDRMYPLGHANLGQRIAEGGALISEHPAGFAPTRWRFLQRNRLIAAVSRATIVVEAGFRSGSLNAAGHAGLLHRPVGAVPGPITSATSAGCHRLIASGEASLVTSVDDVLALLND